MAASNERWLVLAPVLIVFFASVFGSATAGGEFIITHAPSYMTFLQGSNQLANSEISNVIKSVYGFSLSKDLSWDGLAQGSFFEKPKANVVISVVGYDGAPLTIQNTARYPTNDDEPFLNTETVTEHLQRSAVVPIIVDFSVDKTVFDIRSHHPHLFGKLPATFQEVQRVFADGAANFPVKDLGTLNTSSDADLLFLGELHIIQEIIEALKANRQLVNDLSPDFYHFRLRGLSMLVEANGLQSPKVVTAVKLLQTFLAKVTASFKELYGGNVVVEIVTFPKADEASVRIARSLKAEADADLSWDGLAQGSFFEKPKANVVISVVGYDGAPLTIQNTARYPTNDDEPFLNTETVTEHLQRSAVVPIIVDFSVDKTVFDIRSHHPHLFGKLPATFQEVQRVFADGAANFPVKDLGTLNTSSDADLLFLGELHIIQEIIEALKANRQLVNDLSPDFYHFRLRGLSMLVEANGLQSPKVVTAVKLLQTFLAKVTASFKELYGGNVVVEIVTFPKADEASVRIARSLKAEADAAPDETSNSLESDLNVDTAYTGQYPVMFNIILWMMVVLALTVFAVSYGMWYMDPGRDSIIYRMTSQRLKTD